MDEEAARKRYYDFIRATTQGVIATVGPGGSPEAALMDIAVTPDLEIIFETTDQTRKFSNLRARPVIAFVVRQGGSETLQYDGMAEQLSESRALERHGHHSFLRLPAKNLAPGLAGQLLLPGTRPMWVRFSDLVSAARVEEFRFGPDEQFLRRGSWWQRLSGRMPERQRN